MDALELREADDEHHAGLRRRRPGHDVALLDVDGAGVVLTFEVGVDVAHHPPPRAAQGVEGRLERLGPDGGPVAGPPQSEEQVVAALRNGEGEGPYVVCGRLARAVGLDQLLDAGQDVAGVVEDGLLGPQA